MLIICIEIIRKDDGDYSIINYRQNNKRGAENV